MDVPALVEEDDINMNQNHADDYNDEVEDDEEDIDWDDNDDDDEGNDNLLLGPVRCLFCDTVLNSAQEVFSHCAATHGLDLLSFCRYWALDCISYIKLINYIRTQHPSPDALRQVKPGPSCPWEDDSFMKPADPEDLMLQFDIEDCNAEELSGTVTAETATGGETSSQDTKRETGGEMVEIKASELQALVRRVTEAESRATAMAADLERAVSDLNAMRTKVQVLMGFSQTEGKPVASASGGVGGAGAGGEGISVDDGEEEEVDGASVPVNCVERLTVEEDESYFTGYGNTDIHAEMLQDKVRTEGYRDFILGNPDLFKGRTVLDIGCGTGILSLFAARAGAQRVIGVDMSDIIYSAIDISRENKLEKSIDFLKGRMDKVQLPCEKVDVIISEWMGYFLLFESMLDTVISARNKYLTPGGKVYPDKCSMWVAGFYDTKLRTKAVDFWNDVYGFKMTCLQADIISQTSVEVVPPDSVITSCCCIKEFDVNSCSLSDVDFKSPFSLTCTSDTQMHGFIGYFDIGFEAGCSKQVHFSTGPASPSTHWKQTLFMLKTPITVSKGQVLEGSIRVNKNREDPRSLDIRLSVDGVLSQKYIMD